MRVKIAVQVNIDRFIFIRYLSPWVVLHNFPKMKEFQVSFLRKIDKNRLKSPKIAKNGEKFLKKSNVALQVSYFFG